MTRPPVSPGAALKPVKSMPVRMRVAGGGLLLNGRFSHWMPVAMTRDSEGRGNVQLVFDVTGMLREKAGETREDLFSLTARTVRQVAPHTYAAKAMLRAAGGHQMVQATFQTADGHTPFVVVTFDVDRERFGPLWVELERRTARVPGKGEVEMRPWAWLRPPVLAAA